jgi:hypothetical protein
MEALINAFGDVLGRFVPIAILRRPWLRREIHADLELLKAIKDAEGLGVNPLLGMLLSDRIWNDTAKLCGAPVVGARLPVKWGSVWLSLAIGAPLGYWTYTIVRDGFTFWGLLPGVPAGVFLIAAIGLIIDPGKREAPKPGEAAT